MKKLILYSLLFVSTAATANDSFQLLESASRGDLPTVEKLIKKKIKVDSQNKFKETALIKAASNGHGEVVQFLLSQKANINHQDKSGNTALFYAVASGEKKVAILLIDKGADIKIKNNESETVLFEAVRVGSIDLLTSLIQKNPDGLKAQNKEGDTLLHVALQSYQFKVADFLLQKGMSAKEVNKAGLSALSLSTQVGVKADSSLGLLLRK